MDERISLWKSLFGKKGCDHEWSKEGLESTSDSSANWRGCRCSKCGTTRHYGHSFECLERGETDNNSVCALCGEFASVEGRCHRCGKIFCYRHAGRKVVVFCGGCSETLPSCPDCGFALNTSNVECRCDICEERYPGTGERVEKLKRKHGL